jgi:hypothetical protein
MHALVGRPWGRPDCQLACCALQKDEFLRLAINAIHNDLISRNEAYQSLALTFVSNSKPRLQQCGVSAADAECQFLWASKGVLQQCRLQLHVIQY